VEKSGANSEQQHSKNVYAFQSSGTVPRLFDCGMWMTELGTAIWCWASKWILGLSRAWVKFEQIGEGLSRFGQNESETVRMGQNWAI
jgi:hypothetical protein